MINDTVLIDRFVLLLSLQELLLRLNQAGEQLLSMSDLNYLHQCLTPQTAVTSNPCSANPGHTWDEERRALMNTIDALKDLHEIADRVFPVSFM